LHILCIFCIFCAYYFAYYCAYFAYRTACILRIFAYCFAYLMHIILHITLHILHIIIDAYCAHCAYCAMHIVHIVHILDEKVIHRVFIVYCHYCLVPHPRAQLVTYHHLQPSQLLLIYCRKLRESQPLLDPWRRVLSLSHPPEQEEGVSVWRTLESHTKLVSVLVHGVRRRLQIDTDPARLRSINKLEYAKYAKYAEYDLIFGPLYSSSTFSKVGSAYILLICKIWTLHYSAY
jgi:hypothetical protein